MTIAHHATMFRVDSVKEFDIEVNTKSSDKQDVFFDKFGIDDARELVRKAYNRPTESTEQLFIVRTNFITLEAQNALLKVLEEPPLSTRFIFVLLKGFIVLPTLISRFSSELSNEVPSSYKENVEFSTFLKDGYKERITKIEQASKKKDIDWQRSIKEGLVKYIEESSVKTNSLKDLEYAARMLLTRGASNKMLFENVALTLPTRLG